MPGFPCCCNLCCINPSQLPTPSLFFDGIDYGITPTSSWVKVDAGDNCVYKIDCSVNVTAIPEWSPTILRDTFCENVGYLETTEECELRFYGFDLTSLPALGGSSLTIPIIHYGSVFTTTVARYNYNFNVRSILDRFEITLARKEMSCSGDASPKCQWDMSCRIYGSPDSSSFGYGWVNGTTTLTKRAELYTPLPACLDEQIIFDSLLSANSMGSYLETTTTGSNTPNCSSIPRTDLATMPGITRSIKFDSLRPDKTYTFLPESSSECVYPLKPIDDDLENYITDPVDCDGTAPYTSRCDIPVSSNPFPTTVTATQTTVSGGILYNIPLVGNFLIPTSAFSDACSIYNTVGFDTVKIFDRYQQFNSVLNSLRYNRLLSINTVCHDSGSVNRRRPQFSIKVL